MTMCASVKNACSVASHETSTRHPRLFRAPLCPSITCSRRWSQYFRNLGRQRRAVQRHAYFLLPGWIALGCICPNRETHVDTKALSRTPQRPEFWIMDSGFPWSLLESLLRWESRSTYLGGPWRNQFICPVCCLRMRCFLFS